MLVSDAVFDELVLIITDRCTSSCSSCPLACGPNCVHEMDEHLAKDLVVQASSLGFSRITLAGGEPFLFPGLVRKLLECARDEGVRERCVDTNGFWGKWADERIEDAVGTLRGSLTHMVFGFDSFHAEHVDASALWRAIRFADDMPAQTVMRVADVYGARGAGEFLASLGEDALYWLYLVYPLLPLGRAENLPCDWFVGGIDEAKLRAESRKTFCALWDGRIYPCYYPGIPDVSTCLGDAARDPLADILSPAETATRTHIGSRE